MTNNPQHTNSSDVAPTAATQNTRATSAWYNTPARIEALESAARLWEGTPYMANSGVAGPGGGVSCTNLIAELHFATGCLQRFDVPRGHPLMLQNASPDLLLASLDEVLLPRGWVVPTAADQAAYAFGAGTHPVGSLLVIRYGKTLHHLVTMLTRGRIVHVTKLGGTVIEPLASLLGCKKVEISIAAVRYPAA